LTYPEKESMTSSVLALGSQFFAFILTWTYGAVIHAYSAFVSNWLMVAVQAVGIIISAIIQSDLRRQKAEKENRKF
jgi:FLVCR family feline leukemia virus subgroup C receptor-related protein